MGTSFDGPIDSLVATSSLHPARRGLPPCDACRLGAASEQRQQLQSEAAYYQAISIQLTANINTLARDTPVKGRDGFGPAQSFDFCKLKKRPQTTGEIHI